MVALVCLYFRLGVFFFSFFLFSFVVVVVVVAE